MSRHVVTNARRLSTTTTTNTTTTTSSIRSLSSLALSNRSITTSIRVISGTRPLVVPLPRHAISQHTPFRWARSAAWRQASAVGTRNVHIPSGEGGLTSHAHKDRTAAIWTQHRFKSESKGLGEGVKGKDAPPKPEDLVKAPSPEHGRTVGAAGSNKHLLDRLPHLHKPTKEELLAAATGFWQRLGIRFKWFSIRSARPFNTDEIFAFASWIFLGHVVWIIIGTTTFVSLAIFAVNTVFAQETLAGWVGNYLTQSSGIRVVFESAIVPKWGDGVITFKNVFVSRRPGQDKQRSMSKGSSTSAAAAAAAASLAEKAKDGGDLEDTNFTQFDVSLETVNVTLSFTKWFNGKGLLRDVEIHGVRGVVDRTSVHSEGADIDPRSYKHEHHTGDFEIDSFKMEDVLLTLYQPNDFRPFSVSVYNCELPRLRKQWLFYDFLSANNMSGSFDDSLFTIHPRQLHNHTGATVVDGKEATAQPLEWKKHSRLRIDALKIDHLNKGVEGPFGWIHEGNVDIVADIMIPNDEDGSIAKVMSDFYDRMEATVAEANGRRPQQQQQQQQQQPLDGSTISHHDPQEVPALPSAVAPAADQEPDRFLILDLRIHLNDVRASVPLFTSHLSYVSQALVRPIVAYINSKRAFIPVNCRVVKRQQEFDGSWTLFDSGLMDDMSREAYEAFARGVSDESKVRKRVAKVGFWTLQLVGQALFLGLAGGLA